MVSHLYVILFHVNYHPEKLGLLIKSQDYFSGIQALVHLQLGLNIFQMRQRTHIFGMKKIT